MEPLDKASSLEVVYYPSPVPLNLASLTPLGLFFDRIHFPNVYLPTTGYDFVATRAELERIHALGVRDVDTAVLVQAMNLLPVIGQLKEFCEFTGTGRLFGTDDKDPRLPAIVDELSTLLFGPKKEGFEYMHETVGLKGLPGGDEHFEYPGSFYYPATALVYAADHGLPLINDQPLPIPSLGSAIPAKNNEKILSTILAMECAALVLPNIQPLHPLQIVELRNELKPYLRPFRMSVLQLSKDLNQAIEASSSDEEIRAQAEFLVKTSVIPQLDELRAAIARPEKPWYSWAFGAVKYAPSLAAAFASVPLALAAGALTAVCDVLVNVGEAQRKKEARARSGMYFLLKLRELGERASR